MASEVTEAHQYRHRHGDAAILDVASGTTLERRSLTAA
jgi:hypothetical protein